MFAIRRASAQSRIPGFDIRQFGAIDFEFEIAIELGANGDIADRKIATCQEVLAI